MAKWDMYTLLFYKDRQRQWRWRLVAHNGKKVANAGQGYTRRTDCRTIALRLFGHLSPVIEEP